MAIADLDDINAHLPQDKLPADDTSIGTLLIDAERIVKGQLAGVYAPATLAAWADPASTPETIRAIAGRLVAAMYYARTFASETDDVPEYAQWLYDQAMNMLVRISTGELELEEVSEVAAGNLESGDFWPNDTTPAPKFTMEQLL